MDGKGRIGLIVAGVEDSAHGEEAARRAVAYARITEAELHLVHVAYVPASMLPLFAHSSSGADTFLKARSDAVWERVGPLLEGESLAAKQITIYGYPAESLVAYADEVGADLIVVGSRRHGELKSWLLGSTSHAVVNTASCDVMVAREDRSVARPASRVSDQGREGHQAQGM